jgi:hypothetical protein
MQYAGFVRRYSASAPLRSSAISIMLAVQAAVTAAVAVAIASRARKWRLMSAMSGGASQLVAELRLYWISGFSGNRRRQR